MTMLQSQVESWMKLAIWGIGTKREAYAHHWAKSDGR